MNLEQSIAKLKQQYDIVSIVDLNPWHDLIESDRKTWFRTTLDAIYKPVYQDNQRILLTLSRGDVYSDEHSATGQLLDQLQRRLNEIDISNFFVILLTTDSTMPVAYKNSFDRISSDLVPINIFVYSQEITKKITRNVYNSQQPLKINLDQLNQTDVNLLTKSKTFCILPWIHFHAYPTGKAYPCCIADMEFPVGDMRKHTIKEIWNQEPMREIRRNMLNDQTVHACNRCYEQESVGVMSGRINANKHFGHHIDKTHNTLADGSLEEFKLVYWDIRFSNLCNLSCRSCGHIFSSNWYKDQAILAGPGWKKTHQVLNYAGRFETDAWDQLVEHINHVEQIYFAGGEPLLMEEHYRILDELVKRKMFDVRLIYNTNFTHTNLKGNSVFDYWKQFKSVSIGASLDGSKKYGEYIRKGTEWEQIEKNRREMISICPQVDFYISPTLSIMNALHLPDFHRDWVDRGFIKAQDLHVNILQDPPHYRIDIAPSKYKEKLTARYYDHIEWLEEAGDPLGRVTQGFKSAIQFMNATDNTHLLDTFWRKTTELDGIRNEKILDIIPELQSLK
jgi:MoaA/NifB/PqqE/SkfB family radical SAM enzyme